MSDKPQQTINAVIAEIGVSTPVTNAEWGRMFADALLDIADDEAIRHALADAGESYRSKRLSEARAKARAAIANAIKQRGANGSANIAMHQQLGFEVCFEGFPPAPLVEVTHEILAEAERYLMRQHRGIEQNLAFIRQAKRVTTPYPGQKIGDLLVRGLIKPEAFAMKARRIAA